jgi:hypothetical protein
VTQFIAVKRAAMKEGWYLVSSSDWAASRIIKLYGRRWSVEIYQSYCLHKNEIIINVPFLPANDISRPWVGFVKTAAA